MIRRLHPGIAELRDLAPPRGRGLLYGGLFPLANRVPAVRGLGVTGLPIMRMQCAAATTDG